MNHRTTGLASLISAGLAMTFAGPAAAATTVDLHPSIGVFVGISDGAAKTPYDFTVGASATKLARVFDPETRRWFFDVVPAAASAVTVRASLPNGMALGAVQPLNGFVCGTTANTVTCTGNLPDGYTSAVKIRSYSLLTPGTIYPVPVTVDPFNAIPETDETNNRVVCAPADNTRHC
jgi:hypothetical protein